MSASPQRRKQELRGPRQSAGSKRARGRPQINQIDKWQNILQAANKKQLPTDITTLDTFVAGLFSWHESTWSFFTMRGMIKMENEGKGKKTKSCVSSSK